jgi:hypothetical protein
MCMTCGCEQPFDNHMDARNLTLLDFASAGDAAGLTARQAAENAAQLAAQLDDDPMRAFTQSANRPDVAFDIDGVLAFFMECTLAALNAKFGSGYDISKVTNYWMEEWLPKEQGDWLTTLFMTPVFYSNCAPDYAAMATFKGLKRAGFHLIVTSDRPAEMLPVTSAWLGRFQIVPDELVLHGRGSKREVVNAHGPTRPLVFFDDDPRKVDWLPGPGVELWLPKRPWVKDELSHESNVVVFDAWDQARARLDQWQAIPVPMLDTPAVKAFEEAYWHGR